MSTVFVTGANGFIAQHVVVTLLDSGYRVIGSVRSQEKGDQLKRNLKGRNFDFEVVADLGQKDVFSKVLQKYPEIKYVLHNASPVSFVTSDPENDTVIPAVEGMKDILNAVSKYGSQVEKFVYTSSLVTVGFFTSPPTDVINEESWNPITLEEARENAEAGYVASKTFAEKTAWDFVRKENPKFAFCTVNPTFVFGPQAFESEVKATLNASNEYLLRILSLNSTDTLPEFGWTFVDVRDVAKAHLAAIENPKANGQRLLVSNTRFDSQLAADTINQRFAAEYAGTFPAGKPGVYKEIGPGVDDRKSRRLLGFGYIDFGTTIEDLLKQIVEHKKKSLQIS